MSEEGILSEQLRVHAAKLYAALFGYQTALAARHGNLDKQIHDAEAREHRRAAFNRIDGRKYALGGAFEHIDGLEIDPVFLCGFLSLGASALLLLAPQFIASPSSTFVEALTSLSHTEIGDQVRAEGVWQRWNWLAQIYRNETDTFQKSRKGRELTQKWRLEKPSGNQKYLIAEICGLLQLEGQHSTTRGEAFDWIRAQGGNPRFQEPPPRPDLSILIEGLK